MRDTSKLDMEGKEKEHKKHRLKALFIRDKKATLDGDVNDALHSSSDKLYFPAPVSPPNSSRELDDFLHRPSDKSPFTPRTSTSAYSPTLTRIDTSRARRWPTATEIQSEKKCRGQSSTPKRNIKGLVVRFTTDQPEIIGEGGDEAELPTISLRERAQSHRQRRSQDPPARAGDVHHTHSQTTAEGVGNADMFGPGLLRRGPTGFESFSNPQSASSQHRLTTQEDSNTDATHNVSIKTESRGLRSFAARVQADRRSGEGLALLRATSNPSEAVDELSLMLDEALGTSAVKFKPPTDFVAQIRSERDNEEEANVERQEGANKQLVRSALPGIISPRSIDQPAALNFRTSQNNHILLPTASTTQHLSPSLPIPSQLGTRSGSTPQGAQNADPVKTNERTIVISRTSSLNLHGEAVTRGDEALLEFSTRVAHLFNVFLLSAESKIPISKCSFEDFVRAAIWWFLKGRLHLESMIRDRAATLEAQQTNFSIRQQAYTDLAKSYWILETITPQYIDRSSQPKDSHGIDVLETSKATMSSLRKLTLSMKRNNFYPPEEATLPQGLDTSIWIQDDGNQSLLAMQKQAVLPNLNDYFPLGDTNRSFHYGRAFAGAVLMEDVDSRPDPYRCPALISFIRDHNQAALTAVIASQDGALKVCVQGNKSLGPTWDNVAWNSQTNILNVKLGRSFLLQLLCSHQDFRMLRGIYDYQKKTHEGMVDQQDEVLVFETYLKGFQYFDQDPGSTFPKEALSDCRLRVFEKIVVEKAASGARGVHRGFRIGIVTSPNTKNLRGINQSLSPQLPIQLGLLRSDAGLPSFLLSIHDEKSRYRMALTFEDVDERTRLHSCLTGTSLGDREAVVMDSHLEGLSVVSPQSAEAKDLLKILDWQSIRVIDEQRAEIHNPITALSTHLRVITDFVGGSVTDRVNIGPGELKVRLDVNNTNELKVLRQPQQDMTVSVAESQVSKEFPGALAKLLATISTSQTTRTYNFPSLQELHRFQTALTGFSVLFDGTASSLNISRRRMLVPTHKKWDAARTRLQLVQRDKAVQLVAFFENLSHGACMNFALKSTDAFEASGRHAKQTLRIVDAKFAMPRASEAVDASFACLDVLEYPGEHDDVTIVFDSESGMLDP